VAIALGSAIAGCSSQRPTIASPVVSTPPPVAVSTGPVYVGNPAARFALDVTPLGVDPDGDARLLVVSKFFDAAGLPTRILANSDVDWESSDGYVQWQTRMRYGQPSAILATGTHGRIAMRVHVRIPKLGTRLVVVDTTTWKGPRVVARALGPHLVQIGWFPQERNGVHIDRIDGRGGRVRLVAIAGPSSTYRDTTVVPGRTYRYIVARIGASTVRLPAITTPPELPPTPIANVSGKGMWFSFTTNPFDADDYRKLDPHAIVAQAVNAGLHYVELRTAYGGFFEITPEAKPTIDAIIDGLAAHGIGTIAWTVPRDAGFEDLSQSVRSAYYRTANGTRVAGLAVDLERGDEFMGGAPQGPNALWQYIAYLRAALGPRALIVSTVEDPYLGHLTQADYPYAQIARNSTVLQPMAYWRMMRSDATKPARVRAVLRASYSRLERAAGRNVPISIGGQTGADGPDGYPTAGEITASLEASRAAGAIGESFFSWEGTQSDQWAALHAYRW
jgi:hypothetical protein